MAQKIRDDKIGALSHSAGNILMAASVASPAYLTIGGQQFKITSQLSVALPSMTANTRYQVFAVQSAGVVSLVISTRENSQGPIGYSRWKLVGSLYSNGYSPVAFGAFVTVKGTPTVPMFDAQRAGLSAVTTPPTKPTSAVDRVSWGRNGNLLTMKWEYKHDAITGGATGSGFYLPQMPTNLQMNLSLIASDTAGVEIGNERLYTFIGMGHITNQSSNGVLSMLVYDADRFSTEGESALASLDPWSSTFFDLQQANIGVGFVVTVPVLGWTNVPIEDL